MQVLSANNPSFKLKRTWTDTLSTTGSQGEFLNQGIKLKKCRARKFGKSIIELNVRQMVTELEQVLDDYRRLLKEIYELLTCPGTVVTNPILTNDYGHGCLGNISRTTLPQG